MTLRLRDTAALAAVHATVRDGNYALSTGDRETVGACLAQARTMLAVLGLAPLAPPGRKAGRTPGRGDYAVADSIRDTLENTGVLVADTPDGPRWELAR